MGLEGPVQVLKRPPFTVTSAPRSLHVSITMPMPLRPMPPTIPMRSTSRRTFVHLSCLHSLRTQNTCAYFIQMLTWYYGPALNVPISVRQRAVCHVMLTAVHLRNICSDISRLCVQTTFRLRTWRNLCHGATWTRTDTLSARTKESRISVG